MNAETKWQQRKRCDRKASKLYQRRRDIERLHEERKLREMTE